MICAYRVPKFGACIQTAVWLCDGGMGTAVPACTWHIGAMLSPEHENLVYRAELPSSGVEGGEDDGEGVYPSVPAAGQ